MKVDMQSQFVIKYNRIIKLYSKTEATVTDYVATAIAVVYCIGAAVEYVDFVGYRVVLLFFTVDDLLLALLYGFLRAISRLFLFRLSVCWGPLTKKFKKRKQSDLRLGWLQTVYVKK